MPSSNLKNRAYLDTEYNNQTKVKNFKNYVAEWQALSETARSEIPDVNIITYDQQSGQKLDLIFPVKNKSNAVPVMIFFHGGYWKAMNRDLFYFTARAFADYGIATAVVDYQLIPAIQMPELIRQCRTAVTFLHEHAESLGLDSQQIHSFGHSAGGHIAAMCLATNWQDMNPNFQTQLLQSASGVSGLYDLEPISNCFLQDDLHLSVDDVENFSPVKLPKPKKGQMHLLVGADEGLEYENQSANLHRNWSGAATAPHVLTPYNHFSIMSAFADPLSSPSRIVRKALQPI